MKSRRCCLLFALAVLFVSADRVDVTAAERIECNCVLYARSRVPSLPFGLNTREQKWAIINSHTPRVGSVAIHSYNHVSVVTSVWVVRVPVTGGHRDDVYVKILEANFRPCQITTRTGTPAALGIVGYYQPR